MGASIERSILGRDAEAGAVARALDDVAGGAAAVLLEGEAGIGKTTLWAEGVSAARSRLYWVLTACAAEAEAKLAFTALADLLEPVLDATLPKLPTRSGGRSRR